MKHLLYIILILFSVTSCYKVFELDYKKHPYGMFNDICTVGDTTTCYMSCNINSIEVEMYFFKKTRRVLGIKELHILDKIYYVENDTLLFSSEDYRYTQDEFKSVLMEKNNLQRSTSILQYTNEMFFSWDVFDKIYNLYYE